MSKNALIILMRNPQLGCVKTRLASQIGEKKALDVYNALLEYTRSIVAEIDASHFLFYSNFIDQEDSWDNTMFKKVLQEGDGFGNRMHKAFQLVLANHDKAVIIGSDCEELTADIIRNAFEKLSEYDIVLGPAKDGGYYLMGLKKIYPELFNNKKWSTSSVLKDTIKDVKGLGLRLFLLPILSDIDDLQDYQNSKLYEKFN